jgi:hypothetical protein
MEVVAANMYHWITLNCYEHTKEHLLILKWPTSLMVEHKPFVWSLMCDHGRCISEFFRFVFYDYLCVYVCV